MTTPPSRTSVTVTIRKDLADRLDQEADARVVGRALLVEKALEAYLPTLPSLSATDAPSTADGTD